MRFYAAIALAIGLASCSTVKTVAGLSIDQQTVATAVTAYAGVETLADQALALPVCAKNQRAIVDACITKDLGNTIIAYEDKGRAARKSLWAASKADPDGIGALDAYKAFKAATAKLSAAANGVTE